MKCNYASTASPAKQTHLIKLTPLAKRLEASSPVASAECPGTSESKPLVAMLFADNTIRTYDTKSLASVGPVIDLRAKAPHTVISSIDDSTVVTGGTEGCLIVSDVRTGRVSAATQAHDDAVVSIDSWLDYVISVGRDNMLRAFRFIDGELSVRFTIKLLLAPLRVKLFMDGGIMKVLVTNERLEDTQLLRMDNMYCFLPLYLLRDGGLPAEYKLVDLVVNESRTLLAAAFANTSCLKIITGDLRSFATLKGCIINTVKDVYNISKVNWSTTDSRVWITNSDGTVKKVEVGEVPPNVTALGDSKNAVACFQVCRIGGHEVIITGARSGEITLWG